MIRIFTDAAVNGLPGHAGVGILILEQDSQKQMKIPLKHDDWNNHQAEFKAVVLALTWLTKNNKTDTMVFCYTDSQLVAEAIEKHYVKDTTFKKYLEQIQKLMNEFSYITIEWISEVQNKGADNLARQALQKAIKQNK